jgi:hypothetical protein
MLLVEINKQVQAGFSVPIFRSTMEDVAVLNKGLSDFLIGEREKENAESRIDWRTTKKIRGNPLIEDVVAMFGNAISHLTRLETNMDVPASDIKISADVWGSVTQCGLVKSMLNYSPLHWKGIYFTQCDSRTTIEIAPPYPPGLIHGTGKYANQQTKIVLEVDTSTVIIFPARLTHSITHGPGEGLNVAVEVAAGVLLTEKESAK